MDEKDKKIAALEEENRILKDLVATLTKRAAELEAKQNKNSKNSNKPPSSDGLRKGAPKNSREASKRSSGGQFGHEGTTKALNPTPESTVILKPKTQCDCGGEITIQADGYTVRQVTDIQPVQVITVEYQAHNGICTQCGKLHKANFPPGINGTVSYGDNIQAIVTYLNTYQLLPLKRATELVEDLFGIKIAQATIVASTQQAYEKLADTENRIKEELISSDVVHFDETGMRVNGKTHWLHSAGNAFFRSRLNSKH